MFQGHIDLDTATPVEATAIPDVLFERGLYWASGRSGVVNLVAAHKWFNLAALKGRADAIAMRREVAETDVGSRDRRRPARSAGLDDLALIRNGCREGHRQSGGVTRSNLLPMSPGWTHNAAGGEGVR